MGPLSRFGEVWVVDTEYIAKDGERPAPVCLVAEEVRSGKIIKLWRDELTKLAHPPFGEQDDSVIVAYFASAELGFYLALGWPLPRNVIDLYAEFRVETNGLPGASPKPSLLKACGHHRVDIFAASHKHCMRDLILSGGPWTREEQQQILDYCHDDVRVTKDLLARMVACLNVPQALLRGRYVGTVAHMEANGIPLDRPLLDALRTRWDEIRRHLISAVDSEYGVYDGMTFKQARWATWLQERDIPWPRLESGALELKDETFRTMANTYPEVAPIYELRSTLSKLRLNDLAIGTDGRNRTLMSPFGSKSSRCTPRASRFVFGPARWIRGLIKPEPGRALAYLDWDQQEFVIAAALSGDANMLKAAQLVDPYLALAKFAGAAPEGATKQSHGAARNLYKIVTLGVQYGMGPAGLAARTGKSQFLASHLLGQHRVIYPQFWQWSDAVVAHAYDAQSIRTRFGWRLRVGPYGEENERSLRNFPMQTTGADMMRVAAVLMIDRGVQVCASIHDAFLIEATADEIDVQVAIATECMEHAARLTLDGVSVGVGADVIRWPNRYMDERGHAMWETVTGLLKATTAA